MGSGTVAETKKFHVSFLIYPPKLWYERLLCLAAGSISWMVVTRVYDSVDKTTMYIFNNKNEYKVLPEAIFFKLFRESPDFDTRDFNTVYFVDSLTMDAIYDGLTDQSISIWSLVKSFLRSDLYNYPMCTDIVYKVINNSPITWRDRLPHRAIAAALEHNTNNQGT